MHEAVTLALQNSRDLKLARVQYNVALNEAGVDRAAFRPNIYTGSGAAYTYGFRLPGGGPPSLFQLDYAQTIFNPLLKGQQKAAEDRAKNQKLEIDRVQDNVIVRAATAYLELAKVRHSLELMRNEQASAEKILKSPRTRRRKPGIAHRNHASGADGGSDPGEIVKLEGSRRDSCRADSRFDRQFPDTQPVKSKPRSPFSPPISRRGNGEPRLPERPRHSGSRKRTLGARKTSARGASELLADNRSGRAVQRPEQIQ